VIGARSRSYLSVYDAAARQFHPYLAALNSTGRTELSQDGSQVAWINTFDGSLWQSKLDGTQRLQLTLPPMRVFMMRWSPDDKHIAFMGKKPGTPWKIYIVPRDGGNAEMVLDEPHSEADPGWKPDGTALVFGRSPEYMGEDTTEKAIYSLNLKTKVVSMLPGSAGLFSPRLSPDGRHMAAMPLDQRKLMIFDLATNRWSELADKSADNPVWSSDGKWIYFHAFMEEGQPIYRVQISDHRLERIVDFRNLQPAEALEYVGLTKNNEPIILTNVWTANIYAVDWDTP
jgi:Tol biopolymer transport system component